MTESTPVRRPIKARESAWAAAVTKHLVRARIEPNTISLLSIVFAGFAGGFMVVGAWQETWLLKAAFLVPAALFIPLRLLCNLFDGMVAVEGGFRTKSGEIFNELPDRISDVLLLVSAGYASQWHLWGPFLGWAASVLAVMTAYVRALGAQAGASQQFCGPMAKQQRMALLAIGCLLVIVEAAVGLPPRAMGIVLSIIIIGCLVTVARRTFRIMNELDSR